MQAINGGNRKLILNFVLFCFISTNYHLPFNSFRKRPLGGLRVFKRVLDILAIDVRECLLVLEAFVSF